jgi:hypothetical protein
VPMATFLMGPSVEQATLQLLTLFISETAASSASLKSPIEPRQGERKNGGASERLLENLDRFSDEEVNSLLADLLTEEEVSE